MSDNSAIEWCDATKWCTTCKTTHPLGAFGRDRTRGDGLATCCLASRKTGRPKGWHGRPAVNPITGRPGPAPAAARDDDRRQARQRVNVEVRSGRRPHPNALPCVDCGHAWAEGERRHEYDHHLGYAAAHHLHVEPVCSSCHAARDRTKTHCLRGHTLTGENLAVNGGGRMACRSCRRVRDRGRRGAEYWRAYRAARKAESNG